MSGNPEQSVSITLPLGQRFLLQETQRSVTVLRDGRQILVAVAASDAVCAPASLVAETSAEDLLAACQALLIARSSWQKLVFETLPAAIRDCGLLVPSDKEGCQDWLLYRAVIWQHPSLWLSQEKPVLPQVQVLDQRQRYHPLRPAQPSGELYSRFNCEIGARVGLTVLDIDCHLEAFARWQNSERVAAFWEQAGTLEQHRAYLEGLYADPKVLPLIGTIDGEPFAYFEVYWAREDRIAPYYAVEDYDRGIHMLVGEEHHRGPHKVRAWMTALCHFLFLDDPRTSRVVSEPRADNQRMIAYLEQGGFRNEKTFDFPHKTAALMVLTRDRFFQACG